MTNYYHEWWENARKNTGIWTKKTYQDYLEQRIKELEAGTTGQAYLELENENINLKEKLAKTKQEIADSDDIIANLASENEAKEQTKLEAETNLQKAQIDYKNLAILTGKTLQQKEAEFDKRLAVAQEGKANLLKDNLFKETRIKELQTKGEKALVELETQKAKLQTDYENLITDLQTFLTKYKVTNFKELDKRINYQVQKLNKQRTRIERLELAKTEQEQLNQQAQVLFNNTILEIIKKNTTLVLWKGKDMKLAVSQLQELMGWAKISLPDMGGSTTSLPLPNKEKELERKIVQPIQEKQELEQRNLALNADKTELLRKLVFTPTLSAPPIPIIPTPPLKPAPKESKKLTKWKNINPTFTDELIKSWERNGFKYETVKNWVNVLGEHHFSPQDYQFINWIVKIKKLTPKQVLNYGDLTQLRTEFNTYDK